MTNLNFNFCIQGTGEMASVNILYQAELLLHNKAHVYCIDN